MLHNTCKYMHISRMLHAERIKIGDDCGAQISAWKVLLNMCHFVTYIQIHLQNKDCHSDLSFNMTKPTF